LLRNACLVGGELVGYSLAPDAAAIRLGERIMLTPGHCDPMVDRYDWYVGLRKNRVESLWPVAARGAMT
jgi:3-hydroxy-D-aspartate aldolase